MLVLLVLGLNILYIIHVSQSCFTEWCKRMKVLEHGNRIQKMIMKRVSRQRKESRNMPKEAVPGNEIGVELQESAVNPVYMNRYPEDGSCDGDGKTQDDEQESMVAQVAGATWTRNYDEASDSYYLYKEDTGESVWEDEVELKKKTTQAQKRFSQEQTDYGQVYYVPESDEEGDAVWHLPENGILVTASP